MRRRNFGAADMNSVFTQQMNTFKTTLIDLYRKKTKLVAEREALRFQYLTGMKAQILSAVGGLYNTLFSDLNADGEMLTRYIISYIQANIPMVALNGGALQGWGPNAYVMGGRLQVGFLSPITHFLSEPFNDPGVEDQSPAYKIYGNTFTDPNMDTAEVINQYFMSPGQMRTYGHAEHDGEILDFSLPPSREWTEGFIGRYGADAYGMMGGYDYMVGVINNRDLVSIIDAAKTMFGDIVEKTKVIIRLQMDIDQEESDLANFVDEYKSYMGSNQTIDQILAQLKLEADNSDKLPLSPSSADYSVTSTSVAVPSADPALAVTPGTQKPNLLWLAAAGVAAFVMTRK